MRPRPALAVVALLVAAGAHAEVGVLTVSVRTPAGDPVADAVVIAAPSDPAAVVTGRPRTEQIDQIDKEFVPRVKAVYVGSTVVFPNHDNVRHHVYSFSPAKRFELPLYAGVPAQGIVFDKPGVVVLGCNIHDWMIGYVYVSESPYFATTGADGTARIADLPPRSYSVRVWHAQDETGEDATRRTVEIAAGQRASAAWTITLKPEVRVRRAPSAAHGGHY